MLSVNEALDTLQLDAGMDQPLDLEPDRWVTGGVGLTELLDEIFKLTGLLETYEFF